MTATLRDRETRTRNQGDREMRHTITDPHTGNVYPIPSGGAGDNGEDPPEPDGDGDPEQLPDDHPVLVTMRKERDARKAAEAERDKLAKKHTKIVQQHETEQDKAIREAREEARTEALSEVGDQRLRDRIRVAAAKQLNDPEDAVRLLDTDGLDPSDDNLDKEIKSRIDSLVEDKPYLAVSEKRPSGSGDAGSKANSPTASDMNSMIRQAAGR